MRPLVEHGKLNGKGRPLQISAPRQPNNEASQLSIVAFYFV